MKRFFYYGVLPLCAIALVAFSSGCSRNVGSDSNVAPSASGRAGAENPVTTSSTPPTEEIAPPQTGTATPTPEPAPEKTELIQWESSLDSALKKARDTQKPIMIDFYATWCGPCKMLDQQIYPAAAVVQEAKNFVSVKIDVDKEPAIAQKYKITGMPTIVFLGASGQEIDRTQGISDQVSWFVDVMQTARAKVAPTAA